MRRVFFLIMTGLIVAILSWYPDNAAHAQTTGAQETGAIQAIAVEGTARIEPETVRSYLLVREGDLFNAERLDRSLKALFATGLFADVSMRQEGGTLVVKVVENPVINRIAFEGNRRIKDSDLMSEISLKPRVIYTRSKVQSDVNRIQTIYQKSGRFAVSVEPKIIQLPQNRIDLIYEIKEGPLTAVQNIRFLGNRAFSDSNLRDVIRTRETRWYRFLSQDDRYDPDRIAFDKELLRRYYLKNGYADFQVLSAQAELTPDRTKFFITFTVEEGRRYKFGKVAVKVALRGLKAAAVKDKVKIVSGDWYDSTVVDRSVDALSAAAGNLGYAFVDVRPKAKRNRKSGVIDMTFDVKEGPRVFVERINITGNVRTLDKVIRREFRVAEGDAFNASKIRRSIKRIEDLNFFKKVSVSQEEGSAPDKAIVNVAVKEKSTGSLSVGAGYSTDTSAFLELSVKERNLLGTGRHLSLSTRLSKRQSQINLSFTEPYFLNRDIAAGFDVYRTDSKKSSSSAYATAQTGVNLRASYPLAADLRQGWIYTLKTTIISGVNPGASIYIKDQAGSELISSVGHSLTYDKRNSKIHPTEGYYVSLNNDLAGLGGDVSYLRNTVSAGGYHTLAEGWVVDAKGRVGIITGLGQNVSLLDRFFLGGSTLRGFASAGVGPRDKGTLDSLGGEYVYNGAVELSVPFGLPPEMGVSGKIFSDFGSVTKLKPSGSNVYDSASIRVSAGVGVTWVSPVGPISLDFGQALIKESYDNTQLMRVNFGTKF